MIGVYRIRHRATGRAYIGSSDDVRRRLRAHRALLRRGCHDNVRLQRAWARDGEEAFAFEPLEECALERLREREADVLRDCRLAYNFSPVVRRGAEAPNSSVSDAGVLEIYRRASLGAAVSDLADLFGVPVSTVARIVAGRTYKRLTGGKRARPPIQAVGARVSMAKLNAKAVRAIRREYDGKYGSGIRLARKYGVSDQTIRLIVRRKIWQHIR